MADDPMMEGQQSSIPAILQALIFNPDMLAKLNGMDVVLNAVDDGIAKKLNVARLRRFLHETYLDDVDFMRQLKLYSTMMNNTELATELLGQDYLSHPEFAFNADFEKTLSSLNKQLNKTIGLLLKEYQAGETIEF